MTKLYISCQLSIGTLMAYTLVSVCVLILRFRYEPGASATNEDVDIELDETLWEKLFRPLSKIPTANSYKRVNWLTLLCIMCIIAICFTVSKTVLSQWYYILIVTVLSCVLLFAALVIWRQPQVANITTFKVTHIYMKYNYMVNGD